MHGLIAGDGYLYLSEKEYNSYLRLITTSPEIAKTYLALFKKVYGVTPSIRVYKQTGKRDRINLTISKVEILRDYLNYPHRINSANWDTPVEYLNRDGLRGFLSGLLTTDGSVHVNIRDKNRKSRSKYQLRVEFKSKNLEGLRKIKELIEKEFGITGTISSEYKVTKGRREPCYKLRYMGKKAEKMLKLIWSYKRSHNITYRKYKKLKYGE